MMAQSEVKHSNNGQAEQGEQVRRVAPEEFRVEDNPLQAMAEALDNCQRILIEQRVRYQRMKAAEKRQRSQERPADEPTSEPGQEDRGHDVAGPVFGPFATLDEAKDAARQLSQSDLDRPYAVQVATSGQYFVTAVAHVWVTKAGLPGDCGPTHSVEPSRAEYGDRGAIATGARMEADGSEQDRGQRFIPAMIGVQTGCTRMEALEHLERWRALYPDAHFTLVRFAGRRYAILRDLAEVTAGSVMR